MLNFYPGRINTHFKISPTPVLRDRAGNADCCAERYYYNSDTDSEWGHWGDHSVILKEAFRPLHELPKCRLIYRCSSDWERLISISILKASVVGTQWYCTRGDWAVARSVPSFCDCVGLTWRSLHFGKTIWRQPVSILITSISRSIHHVSCFE